MNSFSRRLRSALDLVRGRAVFTGDAAPALLRDHVECLDGLPGDLAGARGNVFLRLAAAETCPAPPPLIWDDLRINPALFETFHATSGGPTAEIGVYRLEDAIYDGLGVVRSESGSALLSPETTPGYWAKDIEQAKGIPVPRGAPVEPLSGPAIACMTPGLRSYGHWLLDILPRLWLARIALGDAAFERHAILVDGETPDWAFDLMKRAAGIERSQIRLFERHGPLMRVSSLVVPGTLHGDFRFHSWAARFFDGLPGSGRIDLPRQFYIPRIIDVHDHQSRFAINAEEIETRFNDLGVPSLLPASLSWPDQIELFRRAEVVVGEFSSSLHNTIFSSAATRVVSLGFENQIQSSIAGFRGQPMAYVAAASELLDDGRRRLTFDADAVAQAFIRARDL